MAFLVHCFQVELEFEMLVFVGGGGGGKLEGCEKNSWSMEENQKQTQPTCDTGSGNQTWTTPHPPLVGSEGPHYCAIPALIC